MTTPERLRRRQRREGFALLCLGILVAGSTYLDNHRDQKQTDAFERCISEQVTSLTRSLNVRGELNARDTDATNRVILTVASATTSADVRAALDQFKADQKDIAGQRKTTTVPPFPNGKCD